MNKIKTNFLLLFLIFFLLNTQSVFSQKGLKQAMMESDNQTQFKKDSVLKLISITKNDTLRADFYFEYFELTNQDEWIEYYPLLIKNLDSVLTHKKVSTIEHKALIRRKAMALRFYYYYDNSKNGAGSKKGIEQLNEAIKLFKESGSHAEVAQTYINLGEDYLRQGKLLDQLKILQEGLNYETENKFNQGISRFYVQLQVFYANIGDTTQSLGYFEKALALEKVIADPTREARGYYLAGLTFSKMMKHQQAIDYLLRSIESFKKENMQQKNRIGQTYLLLGDEYVKIKEYDKALIVYQEIIDISTKNNDFRNVFFGTLSKGRAKSLKGDAGEAIQIHSDILKIAQEMGAVKDVGKHIYKELAQDYYRAKDYNKAKKNMDLALTLSEGSSVIEIYNAEELAYRIDSAAHEYEGAFKHYYKTNFLKQQLNNEEVSKQAAKDRFMNELGNVKAEQEKQNVINNEEKKQQRVITYSVTTGLILIGVFAIFVLFSLRKTRRANKIIAQQKTEVEEQKHLVDEKQKEITDSINYAQRLQQAILPPKEFIDEHVSHNFVLYKPKDIVAGDFYWAEKIDNLFFIAAADSTGHGVPGAMVSVVCSNALNRSVKEFKLTETGKILDKTRELVIETFSKSNANVKDGMDISLLCIDKQNKKIRWSGANNPLWYIQDKELKEIKADKQPIGKTEDPKPFTSHQIEYKDDSTFYLFTDGLPDQFGGAKGKKFMYKQFSDFLVNNSNLAMQQQADLMDKTFEEWKGKLEQVDDVCVIGIRL